MAKIKQLTVNNNPNWSSVMRNDRLDLFPCNDSQMKDPPNKAAKPIESANNSNGEPPSIKSPCLFQFNFGFEDITSTLLLNFRNNL